MANYLGQDANMARILALVHIIVGFILFCFGIADVVLGDFWTGKTSYGIWMGVWMCITGGLGIPGTRKERSTSRDVFAGVFMGFSITSAVFGGIIIISYSTTIALSRYSYYGYYIGAEMALSAIILILGIVEFAIGIWAAVCLCLMKPCRCCHANPPQQGVVMYPGNSACAMTQYPTSGVPLAFPMQAGSGMFPVQTVTPGLQKGQPQMFVVPFSGMEYNQPQFAHIATTSGAVTTGHQPQFAQVATPGAMATAHQPQVKPTYGKGGYIKVENEEI